MTDMERKAFPFELEEKGIDLEQGTFAGYAAVCGNLDDGGDIIDYGAFKKTIAERGPDSPRNRLKVFRYHDFMTPIGKVLEIRETPKGQMPKAILENHPGVTGGLYVKGKISHTPAGDEVLTLMRDSVVDEMSIGYESVKDALEEDEEGREVRHLKEIMLYCCDPVPLAMNPAAVVTDVKALKVEESETHIRIPVPGEAGKHDEHRIRTITISEDEGITALYCGECEKVITYIFDKEKGWTVEKAKEWVKDHQDEKGDALVAAVLALERVELELRDRVQKAMLAAQITEHERAWEEILASVS